MKDSNKNKCDPVYDPVIDRIEGILLEIAYEQATREWSGKKWFSDIEKKIEAIQGEE